MLHDFDRITPNPVTAAHHLAPAIIAARPETDRLRHIPQPLAETLAQAGLYRLFLPRSMGGQERPPQTVFEIIETLSKADASVGWCVMNANAVALGAGWLTPEAGSRMFGNPPNLRAAGSLRPQGKAWPADGGYRLTGRWNFASGLLNANWLFCPAIIMDNDTPQRTPAGTQVTRAMWVPAHEATFIDTWSVMGMRGTGSHDFTINDLFVPAANSISLADPAPNPSPLYRPRLFLMLAQSMFAANAIGIAKAAMESLIDMASREATTMSPALLRDRPLVQSQVGQAEAIVNGARCYVLAALTRLWDHVNQANSPRSDSPSPTPSENPSARSTCCSTPPAPTPSTTPIPWNDNSEISTSPSSTPPPSPSTTNPPAKPCSAYAPQSQAGSRRVSL
jgi:alkylation response protein AidB-like acyl-CoA dehydrogenase